MAITRGQIARELVPGLNALFGHEYAKYAEEHKQYYKTESSDKAYEEEVKLSGFGPAPVKPEGESLQFDEAGELWVSRYTHDTIALGFAITEEAFEDNLYDSLSKRYTMALARSMAHTKQVRAAATLNRAFDSNYKGGDGVSLISGVHPLSVGTVSNISNMDLSEAALEAAIGQIGAWTDDRGLLIAAQPRKLIVPPGPSSFEAARILQSEYRPGTADNDINVISTNGLIPEGWVTNHYLTDPDSWFLTTDVANGLKHFQRIPLKTSSEGDFDTGNMRYKCRERYSFGWSDPLAIYGSPGAP